MKSLSRQSKFVSAAVLLLANSIGCSPPPNARGAPERPAPAPYDFAREGRFPAPPEVEPQPASATLETVDGQRSNEDTVAPEEDKGIQPRDLGGGHQDNGTSAANARAASEEALGDGAARRTSRQGFRVQIFAGRSRELAERKRAEVEALIKQAAYIEYVEPYYKVRIGDCGTRAECDDLEKKLKLAGFESPWIVPASITK